jgi:hypothetical protein
MDATLIPLIVALIAGIFTIIAKIIDNPRIPKRIWLVGLGFVIIALLVFIGFTYTDNDNESPIAIDITSPSEGDGVDLTETVKGTSQNIPENQEIRVFVYIVNRYYPMANPAVVEENGEWSSIATIGGEQDTGKQFGVYAILANQNAKDAINTYNTNSEISGKYGGMEKLPSGAVIYNKVFVIRNAITRVTITFPLNNSNVGRNSTIEGTSNDIPDGEVIWVIVYVPKVKLYYPMLVPAILQPNGSWSSFATFGGPKDIDEKFEIVAVLANQNAQNEINTNDAYPEGISSIPVGTVEHHRVIVNLETW